MPNPIQSRGRLAFITPVSAFGTAVSPTNSNACKFEALDFEYDQAEAVRPDFNDSLSEPLGILTRKAVKVTGSALVVGSGTAGTPPDIGPLLKAALGAYTNTPATSDAYTIADATSYIDFYHYPTIPTTGDAEAACSAIISQLGIEFGGDFAKITFSAEAKSYVSQSNYSGLDTEGKCGLGAFPTKPASPVTNGIPAQGYKGSWTLDGTAYTDVRPSKIDINLARVLYHDNMSDYAAEAGFEGRRALMTNIEMYDSDAASLTTLKGKAHSGTVVALTYVIGVTAGNILTISMPRVRLGKPRYGYGQGRRIVTFPNCRLHPSVDTAKDEISLTWS